MSGDVAVAGGAVGKKKSLRVKACNQATTICCKGNGGE